MSNSGPTQEEYDSLIYKLATLGRELGQARKLQETRPRPGGGLGYGEVINGTLVNGPDSAQI